MDGGGFEPPKQFAADLQSVPFGHSGIHPKYRIFNCTILYLKEHFFAYRDELLISTKAGYDMWKGPYGNWGSRKYLIASLDQSLQRLGLDYVDISSFHAEKKSLPSYLSIGRAFFVCSCIINVQDLQIYTPFQIIDLNRSTKETFGMRVIEQTFN